MLELDQPAVYKGEFFDVYFLVLENGDVPAKEFLEKHESQGGKRARHVQRIKAAIQYRADHPPGEFMSKEHFKSVEGNKGLFEFKAHQLRVYCFYSRRREIVLVFGVVKKRDKHNNKDVRRAMELQEQFLNDDRR